MKRLLARSRSTRDCKSANAVGTVEVRLFEFTFSSSNWFNFPIVLGREDEKEFRSKLRKFKFVNFSPRQLGMEELKRLF